MYETILNVNTLPEPLSRRFRSTRVRVTEDNGNVILAPVFSDESKKVKNHVKLFGALSQESYLEIVEALKDTERVDIDEW